MRVSIDRLIKAPLTAPHINTYGEVCHVKDDPGVTSRTQVENAARDERSIDQLRDGASLVDAIAPKVTGRLEKSPAVDNVCNATPLDLVADLCVVGDDDTA